MSHGGELRPPRARFVVERCADTIGGVAVPTTFDFDSFISAVDSERRKHELRWVELADVLWDQSAELNAHRNDHPL